MSNRWIDFCLSVWAGLRGGYLQSFKDWLDGLTQRIQAFNKKAECMKNYGQDHECTLMQVDEYTAICPICGDDWAVPAPRDQAE